MEITLGHMYRWHATTEKCRFYLNNIVYRIIVRIFTNFDEIKG